jgi:hypothetical protein
MAPTLENCVARDLRHPFDNHPERLPTRVGVDHDHTLPVVSGRP